MNIKRCYACKIDKELTTENYHKNKRSSDGFAYTCKICNGTLKVRNIIHVKDNKLFCLICKEYKLEGEFDINNDKIYRKHRDSRCKKCKDLQREKRRICNRGNGSLERVLLERFHGAKDRAKKSGLIIDFNTDFLIELWNIQKGKCAISNIDMTYIIFSGRINTNVSIDRRDSSIGYIKNNVQLVCMAINQMKSDLTQEELIYFCKNVINNYESKNNKKSEKLF